MNFRQKVKEYIKRHDRLYTAAMCFKLRGDPTLAKVIRGYYGGSYEDNPYITVLATRINKGETKYKSVFLIEQNKIDHEPPAERYSIGLWADMRFILNKAYLADIFGFTPVAYIGKASYYYEPSLNDRTENVYEYYFLPMSGIPYSETGDCELVMRGTSNFSQSSMAHGGSSDSYYADDTDVRKLSVAYRKYVRLRPELREKFTREIGEIKRDGRVLGVHYRGTDYNCGFANHPKAVGIEECVAKASEMYGGGGGVFPNISRHGRRERPRRVS